jgi:hypothetical protein
MEIHSEFWKTTQIEPCVVASHGRPTIKVSCDKSLLQQRTRQFPDSNQLDKLSHLLSQEIIINAVVQDLRLHRLHLRVFPEEEPENCSATPKRRNGSQ